MQHLTINLLLEKKKGEEYLRYVRRERDITFPFFLVVFQSSKKQGHPRCRPKKRASYLLLL